MLRRRKLRAKKHIKIFFKTEKYCLDGSYGEPQAVKKGLHFVNVIKNTWLGQDWGQP
jgi:hypothetical protein